MATIGILATPHPDFPGSYTLTMRSDGKLLGIGRAAGQMSLMRLLEEGVVLINDEVIVSFTDGKSDEVVNAALREEAAIEVPLDAATSAKIASAKLETPKPPLKAAKKK